jgi:hypothetical protein
MTAMPSGPDPEFPSDLQSKAGVRPGDPPANTGLIPGGVDAGHGSGSGSKWIIVLILVGSAMVAAMMIAIGIGMFS